VRRRLADSRVIALGLPAKTTWNEPAAARLAGLLRVFADPARLRILSLLQAQPSHDACVCHVTDFLGLGQPTVSHHPRVLFEAGLVQRERRGNWVYYRVLPGALAALGGEVSGGQNSTVASTTCADDCACR
jgi:ArsR family transcriptional regulator